VTFSLLPKIKVDLKGRKFGDVEGLKQNTQQELALI
jgi:hypothetical protein